MHKHFIHKHVNICFISCVLKILSFKDCLVYQNSFLQIPKCQPGYVSYIFLNFLHFEPYVSLKRRVVPVFPYVSLKRRVVPVSNIL